MTKALMTSALITDMATLLPALDAEPPAMPGDTAAGYFRRQSAGTRRSAVQHRENPQDLP
jgi:hypothetical protein